MEDCRAVNWRNQPELSSIIMGLQTVKKLDCFGWTWRGVAVAAALGLPGVCALGFSSTLSTLDPIQVGNSISNGGEVVLAFDGVVKLAETILISTNTSVDASGHSVSLDAENGRRHFAVTNGAILRLINLTLSNGQYVGAKGQDGQAGEMGLGGSIEIISFEQVICRDRQGGLLSLEAVRPLAVRWLMSVGAQS
jgi:hypothetical protein